MKDKIKNLCILFWTFFKIGLFTFGGGIAMISLIEATIVEKKKWVTSEEMLDIIAIAESTPGPIAVNSATFVGYRRGGILGAVFATLGVVFPSMIIITIIAIFYDRFMQYSIIQKAFKGILCATIVLIFAAGIKLFKPLNKTGNLIINCVLLLVAFALVLFLNVSSILLIACGGLFGWIVYTYFLKDKNEEEQK